MKRQYSVLLRKRSRLRSSERVAHILSGIAGREHLRTVEWLYAGGSIYLGHTLFRCPFF